VRILVGAINNRGAKGIFSRRKGTRGVRMMTGRKCLSPDLKWRRWGDVDKGILVLLQRGWRIKNQLNASAILVTRRKITAAIFLLSM
jgi:hypothetical protein